MTAPRFTVLIASAALAMTATLAPAADASVSELTSVELWQEDKSTVFDAQDIDLNDFLWIARPVIIFADTPADPAFQQQLELLLERVDELVARDVVIITDTSPRDLSDVRRKLRPRVFMLTLIVKDGGVKLRKPFPWDVRELSRSIDKMPLRRQEIRDSASVN